MLRCFRPDGGARNAIAESMYNHDLWTPQGTISRLAAENPAPIKEDSVVSFYAEQVSVVTRILCVDAKSVR